MLKNILMSLAIVSFAGAAVAAEKPAQPEQEQQAPAAEEEATKASN